MTYEQKKIKAKFVGIDNFNLKDFKMGDQNDLTVVTNAFREDKTSMRLKAPLGKKSFAIKGQPAGLNKNCLQTDLADLKPTECTGKVQLTKV